MSKRAKKKVKRWEVTVARQQKWTFDGEDAIEAETEEEAKDKADQLAVNRVPDDDHAYSAEASEILDDE